MDLTKKEYPKLHWFLYIYIYHMLSIYQPYINHILPEFIMISGLGVAISSTFFRLQRVEPFHSPTITGRHSLQHPNEL